MIYDDLASIMGEQEADAAWIETMILNGKNGRINRYLEQGLTELRRALSYFSDAEFEIYTTPGLDDDFPTDDDELI